MPQRKVYLIKRLGWRYNDEQTIPHSSRLERAFVRREQAVDYWLEVEQAARLEGFGANSPGTFNLGSLGDVTTWGEERLLARLREFRLLEPPEKWPDDEPPEEGEPPRDAHRWDDWEWWRGVRESLSDEQFLRFCAAFDKIHFYEIIATELEV